MLHFDLEHKLNFGFGNIPLHRLLDRETENVNVERGMDEPVLWNVVSIILSKGESIHL